MMFQIATADHESLSYSKSQWCEASYFVMVTLSILSTGYCLYSVLTSCNICIQQQVLQGFGFDLPQPCN